MASMDVLDQEPNAPGRAGHADQASTFQAQEREALGKIVQALRNYRMDAEWEISRWEFNYSRLSTAHREMLPNLPAKIAAARHCAHQNHLLIKQLLATSSPETAPEPLCSAVAAGDEYQARNGDRVSPQDAEKVRYLLKNLARDWSAEGAAEREQSYGRILKELRRALVAGRPAEVPPPLVLVPGCGLGRLCAEVAGLGCEAIGNEFSYYMLLGSSFVLNHSQRAEQWSISPWLLNPCNHMSDGDQLRTVLVPDVLPSDLVGTTGLLGMAAGDFVEAFGGEEYRGHFDAVATCFFIDTAHNVVEYMETIWNALKPGGRWVNLGPLLWHWWDSATYLSADELSVELSLADVERVAQQLGFKFLQRELVDEVHYMADPRSMLRQAYRCVFWTAEKPTLAEEEEQQSQQQRKELGGAEARDDAQAAAAGASAGGDA